MIIVTCYFFIVCIPSIFIFIDSDQIKFIITPIIKLIIFT